MAGLEIEFNVPLFICLLIIAILIVFLNIFNLIVIYSSSQLRNVTGYLMASLSVADISVGITTLIPLIYATFTDRITNIACDLMGFVSSTSWVVSIYTLMILTLDRYIAIVHPLHYNTYIKPKFCAIAIAITWLFSGALWMLPLFVIGDYKFNDEEVACYFDVAKYPIQWTIYMIIIFVPTSITVIICYGKLYFISRKQKRTIDAISQFPADTVSNNGIHSKALRTIVIIVGAFYLAWTPFVVEHLVKAKLGKLENIPEWLEIALYVVAVTNSFWNPLIYIGTNKSFRVASRKVFLKMFPCLKCLYTEVSPDSMISGATTFK